MCRTKSLQLCPTLCNPMDCSPPGFSVHGILQARILEWVASPAIFPTQRRNKGQLHCRRILHHWATWEAPLYSTENHIPYLFFFSYSISCNNLLWKIIWTYIFIWTHIWTYIRTYISMFRLYIYLCINIYVQIIFHNGITLLYSWN